MNHPNQSSASADLNKAALIVLVSASCQPSLGVFQHTLPNFAVTGKFHEGTHNLTSHTMTFLGLLIGQSTHLLQQLNCHCRTAKPQQPNI